MTSRVSGSDQQSCSKWQAAKRLWILVPLLVLQPSIFAQDEASTSTEVTEATDETAEDRAAQRLPPRRDEVEPLKPVPAPLQKILDEAVSLNPVETVYLDKPGGRVLLRTQVACENCPLEMLCCLEETKEHESILTLRAKAETLNVGLLALGAKKGRPAEFYPKFVPPEGQIMDIFVHWVDKKGKPQRATAQSWIRRSVSYYFSEKLASPPAGIKLPYLELRYDPYNNDLLWYGQMSKDQRDDLLTKSDDKTYQKIIQKFYKVTQPKPMTSDFVFTGSGFVKNERTGKDFFTAERGALICVANFSAALIDVDEASSAADGGRSYEAWPGKVPKEGTVVLLEIVPRKQAPNEPKPSSSAAPKPEAEADE